MLHSLNTEQKYAFDTITTAVQAGTPKVFILDAPAGRGKTYLINCLQNVFKSSEIRLLAPTNKACSLLGEGAVTIHSFFGSKSSYSEEGNQHFKLYGPNQKTLKSVKLVVVDEASMVSVEMLEIFTKLEKVLLFVCDRSQLPPINEKVSPIFLLERSSVEYISLTENMRSSGAISTARDIVDEVREKGYTVPVLASLDEVIEDFKNKKDVVVLAYTNKRVAHWNDVIRRGVFGVTDPKKLEKAYVGECFFFTGERGVGDQKRVYNTSDVIRAVKVEKIRMNVVVNAPSVEDTEGVETAEVCFYRIIDEDNQYWLIPLREIDTKVMKNIIKGRRDYCSKKRNKSCWAEFYEFVNTYSPALVSTYCTTVHKAQGSEFLVVYVDYANMMSAKEDTRRQLLYTAVSRMREEVKFIGSGV